MLREVPGFYITVKEKNLLASWKDSQLQTLFLHNSSHLPGEQLFTTHPSHLRWPCCSKSSIHGHKTPTRLEETLQKAHSVERTFNILPIPCKGIESSTKHRPFFNNWFSSEHITTHVKRGLSSGANTTLNDSTWAKILQRYVFLQKNKETPALGNVSTSRPGSKWMLHAISLLLDLATCPKVNPVKRLGVHKTHCPFKFHPKVLQNLSRSLCKTWQEQQNTTSTQAAQTFLIKTWRTHDFILIRRNDATHASSPSFISFTRFGSILPPTSVFSRASGSAKRTFSSAPSACWSAEREKTLFHPSRDTTAAWRHTGGGQPALLPT